jgi:hypothetical protein
MEQSPALAFIAHPPDYAGRLPDKQAETSSAGATERVRVHHAPNPAVAEVQDATRLYCLRQALGTAPEGMRKQLGKERLPARAPWRDNEFWHTQYMVFIAVRWRATRRSSLFFRKTFALLLGFSPDPQGEAHPLIGSHTRCKCGRCQR